MPLLEFLSTSPAAVEQMSLTQIIATCGDGNLRDGSDCSSEFKQYLNQIDTSRLTAFIDTCLMPGSKLGFALQDLVNEIGRRLDLEVENGRYHGTTNAIGFDGIWRSSTGHAIVVEVKTTDAYRINLDTIASYRKRLIQQNEITEESSILIVVLREETGDLEAQVRGSRHAWDIRIVSADALIRLLHVKERTESKTQQQIEHLLIPFEYTRLDRIIDVTFAAVQDVEETDLLVMEQDVVSEGQGGEQRLSQVHTPTEELEAARKIGLAIASSKERVILVKKSRAKYSSVDGSVRVVCAVSKIYEDGGMWFAYHPEWDSFLSEANIGYFVLVGVGLPGAFLIPRNWLVDQLPNLWSTSTTNSQYNHIVVKPSGDSWQLSRRQMEPLNLLQFHQIASAPD